MQFSMTCSCGQVMSVAAASREEAVEKMKGTMDEAAVAAHMAEKHASEPALSVDEVRAAIDQNLQPA